MDSDTALSDGSYDYSESYLCNDSAQEQGPYTFVIGRSKCNHLNISFRSRLEAYFWSHRPEAYPMVRVCNRNHTKATFECP